MTKILIADDHFIVRTGLVVLIKDLLLNVEVDECQDGDSAWQKIQLHNYDLAILDLSMPGTATTHLLKNIFDLYPQQKVLILTMSSEDIYAKKYLQTGVRGFITKEAPAAELRKAILDVLDNKLYISDRVQHILNRDTLEKRPQNPFDNLSTRELEVMMLLIDGKNVSDISHILSIHTSTVGTHKARIMQKLGISTVFELSKMAKLFTNTSAG